MSRSRCRLCSKPLVADLLKTRKGLAAHDVHTRCAQEFLEDAAFALLMTAFDADDHATTLRWAKVWESLIALDPPRHVAQLLADAREPARQTEERDG